MKKIFFALPLLVVVNLSIFGQSPYKLGLKKDGILIGSGLAFYGLGEHLQNQVEPLTNEQIANLMESGVNNFDAIAFGNNSSRASDLSDILENKGFALPLIFLVGKKTRNHFGQIAIMYGELYLIERGLTRITKTSFRRTRPLAYGWQGAIGESERTWARSSFVSGHTSGIAAQTFFVAKVFADFYPESKWKPVVWGSAAAIPAFMGYLRVKGGKHFPTDVIGGYALGAAIGYLVPHLHKNNNLSKHGLSINAGADQIYLTWNFNQKPKYQ